MEKSTIRIEPLKLNDKISGNRIKVASSPFYYTISINNRTYYFNRADGTFDGTSTDFD